MCKIVRTFLQNMTSTQAVIIDSTTVGFFNNIDRSRGKPIVHPNYVKDIKAQFSLMTNYIDFEEALKHGHWNPQAHCSQCNGFWYIIKDTPLWEEVLSRVRGEHNTFQELELLMKENKATKNELETYKVQMFDLYELSPYHDCPTCCLNNFHAREKLALCENEIGMATFRLKNEHLRHQDHHCKNRHITLCNKKECYFVTKSIKELENELEFVMKKWEPFCNLRAVQMAKQLKNLF